MHHCQRFAPCLVLRTWHDTHDSWPMWLARPSSQWTCTIYSLPVSPAHPLNSPLIPFAGPKADTGTGCERSEYVGTDIVRAAETNPRKMMASTACLGWESLSGIRRICRFKGRGSWMVCRCAWNFCSGLAMGELHSCSTIPKFSSRHKSAFSPAHLTSPKTALRPAPRRGNNLAAIEIVIDGQRDSR